MATPAGSPSWYHTNDGDTYGAPTDKENFAALGVVNPETDVGAEQFVRLCEDVAAIQRTSATAFIHFTCNDTDTDPPTVHMVRLANRVYTTPYAGDNPPTGLPTLTRSSDGVVFIDMPTTLVDDYGVEGDIDIKGAITQLMGTDPGEANYAISDEDSDDLNERLTIRVQDDSGVLLDKTVTVEIYT